MKLDLNRSTTRQLVERLTTECSTYGTVRNVSLYGFPVLGALFHPFAVVEMSSRVETARVREALGEGESAGGVVIPLDQMH